MHEIPIQTRQHAPPGPHAPQPAPPQAVPANTTTRHLCAGAWLDKEYRDAILDKIYHQPMRAVAPNHGADGARVLAHARSARATSTARHVVAASTALLLFLVIPFVHIPVAFAGLLLVWGLVGAVAQRAFGADPDTRARPVPLIIGAVVLLLLFAMGPAFQAMESSGSGSDSDREAAAGNGAGVVLMVLALGVLLASSVVAELTRARRVANLVNGQNEPATDRRIEFVRGLQGGSDVVNYSPHRDPFVGAGESIATWQFAMPLRTVGGDRPKVWPGFDSAGLNAHVRAAVAALAEDHGHSRFLPGLELSDQLYVSGTATTWPVHTLADLAQAGLPAEFPVVQADPTGPIRHYLRCQATSWDGETVTTFFIHTAVQGDTLYMEFHSYALPPTSEAYHVFGPAANAPNPGTGLAVAKGITRAPLALVTGPIGAVRAINSAIRNKLAASGGTDDTGALVSIRELGSRGRESYFQNRDAVKYTEILEAQLLKAVKAFLDGKVDIQQLTGFAQTIINNGIVNYGQVNAGAIGEGAQATIGAVGDHSRGSVNA
ncbi:hypothetical protein [Glycomyces sp. NRRL B-16210]|uniref:hypothetical protein n=1 Tax=Glycomyces sp. NRRL B-16210 TaxID=1463821 RepID=UPI0004C22248|nr:hypothetical protein [Glycomyces sp. NRRL B-16210]